jgi:uncharacterized membrane protein HdeD (DUF308 family)
MKIVHNSVFRAVCAVIIGVLLIKYRDQAVQWLTIAIGILFFLAGVVAAAGYVSDKHAAEKVVVDDGTQPEVKAIKPAFPIVGIGSIILGIILALMPITFINIVLYILAAILILGAISQYVNLASVRKIAHIGLFYWIMPSLILLVSIYTLIYPQKVVATTQLIIGWCILVFGVVECINAIKIAAVKRVVAKRLQAENAEAQSKEAKMADEEVKDSSEPKV